MNAPLQILRPLPSAIEAALRASIKRFGVLAEVHVDQHGRIIDGHHRVRIAEELGLGHRTKVVHVKDDEHARELALTLNADRRQLGEDERKELVAALRVEGHSVRAIAGALGTSKSTVDRDLDELSHAGQLTETPKRVKGLDGKSRQAKVAKPKTEAKEKKPRKPKKLAPAPDPEAEKYAPDLVEEFERANKEIQEKDELIASLQKSDLGKEVAKWKLKFDQLSGRLQQEMAAHTQAKKDAQRHFDLLTKIRKVLKVDKPSEILPAIEVLRKAAKK